MLNTELTAGNGTRLRLLVVDDQEEMRRTLSSTLRLEGFEVTLAATGSRALELLNSAFFDLVMLDVNMPDMDGFWVLAKMRERPESVTLPVIMVTGADDTESVLRGKKLGVDDYLVKPFRVAELLSRIEHCLSQPGLKRGVRLGEEHVAQPSDGCSTLAAMNHLCSK